LFHAISISIGRQYTQYMQIVQANENNSVWQGTCQYKPQSAQQVPGNARNEPVERNIPDLALLVEREG
jgi:hypothetical protein